MVRKTKGVKKKKKAREHSTTQLLVTGQLASFLSFSPAQVVENLAETASSPRKRAKKPAGAAVRRFPMKEKKLTIAVALARDRLPLSETRDVDVLLRPCVFVFFLYGRCRRRVERAFSGV